MQGGGSDDERTRGPETAVTATGALAVWLEHGPRHLVGVREVSIKSCHNMQQASAIWVKLFITEQPTVTQVLCPKEQSRVEPRSTKTLIVPEQITNQSMKLIRWTAVGPKRA
uniref:Uncharacterized protein n=1 Tax=Populus alba TaxID=43335 RepID=A0A4U5NPU7_POPAL|nr:hypothetical protein D5086_0000253370 [Populus alba]